MRGVLSPYVAAPCERAGHPPEVGHRRWAFFSNLLGCDRQAFPRMASQEAEGTLRAPTPWYPLGALPIEGGGTIPGPLSALPERDRVRGQLRRSTALQE